MKYLLLFFVLFLGQVAVAKFQVVYLVDTEAKLMGDDIGRACQLSQQRLQSQIEKAAKALSFELDQRALFGTQINEARVLAHYRRLVVSPEDTLLFYYCGHGVISQGQPQFTSSGGPLWRQRIREVMLAKKAKLTLLISDTCGSYARSSGGLRTQVLPPALSVPINVSTFSDLFLESKGFLDVTGSQPGQISWFWSETGGAFSGALSDMIAGAGLQFDKNANGQVEWKELVEPIKFWTNENFLTIKNGSPAGDKIKFHHSQTPNFWSIP